MSPSSVSNIPASSLYEEGRGRISEGCNKSLALSGTESAISKACLRGLALTGLTGMAFGLTTETSKFNDLFESCGEAGVDLEAFSLSSINNVSLYLSVVQYTALTAVQFRGIFIAVKQEL